ncbi:MAG: hypothetical protein OXG35_17350 [Acidobacteria bacterium]|nr:hypothetical protein [Acidobacteriota bacterium]
MSDAPSSVHRSPFHYQHPVYRAAADKAKARSRGRHCQSCGRKAPLEAHHWGKPPYPPPQKTIAADLTALCVHCHITAHLTRFYEAAGGSPETLCGAWSEIVATLLLRGVHLPGGPTRVGRPVQVEGQWVALVTGREKPAVGEVVALFLYTRSKWQSVVVTEVLGGCPGCWRVRKRFRRADEPRPASTAMREVAA